MFKGFPAIRTQPINIQPMWIHVVPVAFLQRRNDPAKPWDGGIQNLSTADADVAGAEMVSLTETRLTGCSGARAGRTRRPRSGRAHRARRDGLEPSSASLAPSASPASVKSRRRHVCCHRVPSWSVLSAIFPILPNRPSSGTGQLPSIPKMAASARPIGGCPVYF